MKRFANNSYTQSKHVCTGTAKNFRVAWAPVLIPDPNINGRPSKAQDSRQGHDCKTQEFSKSTIHEQNTIQLPIDTTYSQNIFSTSQLLNPPVLHVKVSPQPQHIYVNTCQSCHLKSTSTISQPVAKNVFPCCFCFTRISSQEKTLQSPSVINLLPIITHNLIPKVKLTHSPRRMISVQKLRTRLTSKLLSRLALKFSRSSVSKFSAMLTAKLLQRSITKLSKLSASKTPSTSTTKLLARSTHKVTSSPTKFPQPRLSSPILQPPVLISEELTQPSVLQLPLLSAPTLPPTSLLQYELKPTSTLPTLDTKWHTKSTFTVGLHNETMFATGSHKIFPSSSKLVNLSPPLEQSSILITVGPTSLSQYPQTLFDHQPNYIFCHIIVPLRYLNSERVYINLNLIPTDVDVLLKQIPESYHERNLGRYQFLIDSIPQVNEILNTLSPKRHLSKLLSSKKPQMVSSTFTTIDTVCPNKSTFTAEISESLQILGDNLSCVLPSTQTQSSVPNLNKETQILEDNFTCVHPSAYTQLDTPNLNSEIEMLDENSTCVLPSEPDIQSYVPNSDVEVEISEDNLASLFPPEHPQLNIPNSDLEIEILEDNSTCVLSSDPDAQSYVPNSNLEIPISVDNLASLFPSEHPQLNIPNNDPEIEISEDNSTCVFPSEPDIQSYVRNYDLEAEISEDNLASLFPPEDPQLNIPNNDLEIEISEDNLTCVLSSEPDIQSCVLNSNLEIPISVDNSASSIPSAHTQLDIPNSKPEIEILKDNSTCVVPSVHTPLGIPILNSQIQNLNNNACQLRLIPGFEVKHELFLITNLNKIYAQDVKFNVPKCMVNHLLCSKTDMAAKFCVVVESNTNFPKNIQPLTIQLQINGITVAIPSKFNGKFTIDIRNVLVTGDNLATIKATIQNPEIDFILTCAAMIVKKLSTQELMEELKTKVYIPSLISKKLVIKRLEDGIKKEIFTNQSRIPISLKCPIRQTVMETPCKGILCKHFECFDALNFFKLYENLWNWICPICHIPLEYEDLRVDGLFEAVLKSMGIKVKDHFCMNKEGLCFIPTDEYDKINTDVKEENVPYSSVSPIFESCSDEIYVEDDASPKFVYPSKEPIQIPEYFTYGDHNYVSINNGNVDLNRDERPEVENTMEMDIRIDNSSNDIEMDDFEESTEEVNIDSNVEDYDDEDDPKKLWCICRTPHNNRFMIGCDHCDEWFHGKCVGITRAQGKNMKEIIWYCPSCRFLSKNVELQGNKQKLSKSQENNTLPGSVKNSSPLSRIPIIITKPCSVHLTRMSALLVSKYSSQISKTQKN